MQNPATPPSSRRPAAGPPWFVMGAAFFALFLALYWQATGFQFINFLENAEFLAHPEIAESQKLPFAFSASLPWQPVAWISHMFDFGLFGNKGGAHRTMSLLLHVANVLLVFVVFRRLTGAFGASLATALLWGLHPMRVEPVVWLVERRMLLATAFALLAIWAYAVALDHPRVWWRRALAWLPALLAASSHPAGAALPVLLLTVDAWPLRRTQSLSARIIEKWPFWLISAATVAMVARGAARGADTSWIMGSLGLGERLGNALLALLVSAPGKSILPHPLSSLYWNGPGVPEFIGSALLFSAVALFRRSMLPGLVWFLAALIPTLGLVHPEFAAWGDRGTYLAHIGLIAAAVWTALELGPHARWIALAAGLIWAGLGWARIPAWQSTDVALRAAVDQGGHPLARYLLAQQFVAQQLGVDAERQLLEVIKQRPRAIEARLLLGSALALQQRLKESADVYREVIRQAPNRPEGYYGLGMMQTNMKEVMPGIENFGRAIERGLEPVQEATAENAIAIYWLGQQNWRMAEQHSRRAWQLVPGFANAHRNYATALARQEKVRQAFAHIERARLWTKEDPQVVEVWAELYNRMSLDAKKKRDEEEKAEQERSRKK